MISTGPELLDVRVRGTNFESAQGVLGNAGFEVLSGGVVDDDLERNAGRVAHMAYEGFGVVITTGGVAAEAKDKTVEALLHLDTDAATAIIASFKPGYGCHVKPSIRIAVAQIGYAIVIALPGPAHEVQLALPVLVEGLKNNWNPSVLVEALAKPLRNNILENAS